MSRTECFIRDFEFVVAQYAGCRNAVALGSFSDAIFVSVKDSLARRKRSSIALPCHCDLRTATAVVRAAEGVKVGFVDRDWQGDFEIGQTSVVDSSCRFNQGMYRRGEWRCLDFGPGSHLPIGGGGMVLTDSDRDADWIRRAIGLGVVGPLTPDNQPEFLGWDSRFRPEDAVRGIELIDGLLHGAADIQRSYPDLSRMKVFR